MYQENQRIILGLAAPSRQRVDYQPGGIDTVDIGFADSGRQWQRRKQAISGACRPNKPEKTPTSSQESSIIHIEQETDGKVS